MTEKEFVYWLRDFFKIHSPQTLSAKQTKIISDHLKLVFNKVTPESNSVKQYQLSPVPPFITMCSSENNG